ncbi:MAG: nucleotidyl transferase AbiEii/AbiGii toxin family protein, partial [Bacteroidota bacterium]
MFSAEYLNALAAKTGFQTASLQKQMSLIIILREIQRHPLLSKAFVLRGGKAINLFWYNLPRLSVDIDLNYIGSVDKDLMQQERGTLEKQLSRLLESLGISVERKPDEHAGGKWRLRATSAFGGNFTLEIDLNYIMRIPVWGVHSRAAQSPDADYSTDFPTVSLEELFAGKIKALMDRSAARDLYDVYRLVGDQSNVDPLKLKKALILFGVTCEQDWRQKGHSTIDAIDKAMAGTELSPLLRSGDEPDLKKMKTTVKAFLAELMKYNDDEQLFLDRFLDRGIYEPQFLFKDSEHARALSAHPAVLWKLQNHRKFVLS